MKRLFFLLISCSLFSCRGQNLWPDRPPAPLPDTLPAIQEKNILFSGYQWTVRQTRNSQGPGPNFFNDSSVWVDRKGWLHLQIRKNAAGQWQCAEIISALSFEYGTYLFELAGAVDKLDKNVVLGLFNYSGNDGLDEMDIEFARWGNTAFPNLNYTVWPAKNGMKQAATVHEFALKDSLSTHYFRRTAGAVFFRSFAGPAGDSSKPIFASDFLSPAASISRLAMPVHLNFWLFGGNAPTNGTETEVVVRRFGFTP